VITSETRWAHGELKERLRPFIAQRVSPCDVDGASCSGQAYR
jgi:hypothetical protein